MIGDMGVASDGTHKPGYTEGIEIRAPITVLGEGCRGHLSKRLIAKFKLDAMSDPQTYGIGLKELWQVPEGPRRAGQDRAYVRLAPRSGRPTAAASSTTWTRTASRLASSPGSIMSRSRVQAVRGLPATQEPSDDQSCSKVARSSRPAHARSSKAATSRCRRSRCRGPC